MRSDVMTYYRLTQELQHVGYFETAQHHQIVTELTAAIKQGKLVALSGIVGCGKTTLLHRLQEALGREQDMIVSKSLAVDKDRVNLGTLIMALFYDVSIEKDVRIPTQPEKRERQLLELIHRRQKAVVLFVDEAHDLHGRTLLGLKRLMELVRASRGILSVVLAGHPKLTNDLHRSAMEEIGARATIFTLTGVKGHQRDYILWLLEQCTGSYAAEELLTDEALALLADRLTTPLQIEHYLTRAFEEGYKVGQRPITSEVIEGVLAHDLESLEPRLVRQGYNAKAVADFSMCGKERFEPCSTGGCRHAVPRNYSKRCLPRALPSKASQNRQAPLGRRQRMEFYDVLDHVLALLRQRGRASYRALQVQFALDDAQLEALKDELLFSHPQIVDEDGRGLVWTGDAATTAPRSPEVAPPPSTPPTPDAERRQLTVLFCDLADSTRLARQLDPEDLRTVVRAYQETAAAVIERYEGHIAQYLGDGLLVYFGYPQAHEDDAQRAVRTGLELLTAMRTLNTRLVPEQGVRLAVRIGIHTGPVVVGELGRGDRREHLALGETPNVAARLQSLAASDTVVLSDMTARLVQGYFVCQDRGVQTLKGLDTPVRVVQVVGEGPAQSRLDAAAVSGLTPLVGREAEVALLRERWTQSTDGRGQVVVLSGEAGIGKSRLVRVLTEEGVEAGVPRLTLRCSPYHTNSALYPVIAHLQRLLHWHREETPDTRLASLEQAVQTAHLPLAEVVPLLATLLALPLPAHYPPLTLSPQRQKQQTLEALVAWLLAEAMRQPVLVVWEDLHWADPSTLELLALLLDQVPTARLLLVLTCRPEFRLPWALRSYITPLTLTRLGRPQVEEMVLRVTGGKPLPAEVVQQIVAKTDGIPLFVEELVKTILESGLMREEAGCYVLTGPVPPLAIPATLQDALMARLDRLAVVKEVAQLGAVLGREFSYALLRAVAPLEEATLQQSLAQLVEAELLYQRGHPPQATYLFKHALVQDAAYQSLLRSTRQQSHQRIAQVLEAQFPSIVETQPELLAHHYTEAGLSAQAIPYWQRAGERAMQRSANLEAVSHLTRGLEVLTTFPDTPERTQQELALHLTLGPALGNTRGRATPEAERVYVRACALGRQVGDTRQLFPALWGLYYIHQVRGQLQRAREVGEELFGLAQQLQDPLLSLEAHRALGNSLFWRGELGLARTHVTHALALYDPQQMRDHAVRYGQDSGVACRLFGAGTLWLLGYPDQALRWCEEALTYAQGLRHAFVLNQALIFSAILHHWRREAAVALERAEAQRALCTEHGFADYLAWGTVLRGAALAAQGTWAEGLAQMREGLTTYLAIARLPWLLFLGLLIEACERAGQVEEGQRALREALEAMQTTEERLYEAEVYRLQGELLLQQSANQQGEAEASLQRALEVARRQQAKSLELRAAMSLARLWQQQGKKDQARELLAPIYGWFTEGFDTADLKEAKAVLDTLVQ